MPKKFDLSDAHEPQCDFCKRKYRAVRRLYVANTGVSICCECAKEISQELNKDE